MMRVGGACGIFPHFIPLLLFLLILHAFPPVPAPSSSSRPLSPSDKGRVRAGSVQGGRERGRPSPEGPGQGGAALTVLCDALWNWGHRAPLLPLQEGDGKGLLLLL